MDIAAAAAALEALEALAALPASSVRTAFECSGKTTQSTVVVVVAALLRARLPLQNDRRDTAALIVAKSRTKAGAKSEIIV